MSLVCGQCIEPRLFYIDRCGGREKQETANTRVAFSLLASLPSLRPIATLISDKFKQLRKRKSTYKNGSKRHMNTVKSGNAATFLPFSRKESWTNGHRPMLDSSSVIEMDTKAPHIEANLPGNWISEIEAVEPALEMGAEKTVAKMDAASVRW